MSTYERVSVVIQFLTLLALGLYTFFAHRQWRAMLDANKRTDEAVANTDRALNLANTPWILLESIEPILRPSSSPLPPTLTLNFKNFGRGVAVSAEVSVAAYVTKDEAGAEEIVEAAMRNATVLCSVAVGPGQAFKVQLDHDIKEWSEAMETRKEFLRVAGEIHTLDVLGERRTIGFGQYLVSNGTWEPSAFYDFWQQARGLVPSLSQIEE